MKHNRNDLQHLGDSWSLFGDAQAIATRLITESAELAHLERGRLPCVLSQRALVERGRAMPAVVLEPQSSVGSSAKRGLTDWLLTEFVRPLLDGFEPDYVLAFDVALWPAKHPTEAEHVVYHALCHIEQKLDEWGAPRFYDDGRAHLRIRSHDVERFTTEIQRYGHLIEGIQDERGIYAASRERERRASLRLA